MMSTQSMVQDYYQVLGAPPGASALEIKKAYFFMVRKYPPEQFPEEFKKIREAYEALSNEETRKEYDFITSLPPMVKDLFVYAREALEEENLQMAISLLEELVERVPDASVIEGLLAEAYLKNGNSGKAIKILEALVEKQPQHAGFNGHLAHAYLMRGWHKKSLDVFRQAISLDEDNLSLWNGLSEALSRAGRDEEARQILLQALEKGKEKGWDNAGLYFKLVQLDIITENFEAMEEHLAELTSLAAEREDIREGVGWALKEIALFLVRQKFTEEARAMVSRAASLLPDESEIQELKEELDYYESLRGQLEELEEDESIHEDITSLVAVSIMPAEAIMGNEFRDAGLFFNEFAVLEQAQRYLPSVKRLEKHYPDLYATRADFFEGLKDHRKRNKMLKSYEKKLPFYSMIMEQVTGWDNEGVVCEHCGQVHEPHNEDDAFGEWHAPQEPYIREEPKVGRNEPCPCGSGKKYKKCCGKN